LPPTPYAEAARRAAESALTAYDLPSSATLEPIRLLNNAVYAVTTRNERFVLRVHRPHYRQPEHIRSELDFLDAVHANLAAAGVRVPKPVPAKYGARTVAFPLPGHDIIVHCDLLTWVDGRVRRPGTGLGPDGVHQIGRALAHLHRAAETFTRPADFQLPTWNSRALFTEDSPYRPGRFRDMLTPADRSAFDTVADQTTQILDHLGHGPDAYGIVHHDFILLNCHPKRTPQSWSIGVIDFDETGWGHYLADLAPILGNLSDYPHYPALRTAFLNGYRTVRDLPAELETHLPVLMAARHAAQCLWAAGLAHSNGSEAVDTAEHLAYRMWEIRRCLAMRDDR
jgi:Ser/Thr protein kinase RdoA (MazF antagonist)